MIRLLMDRLFWAYESRFPVRSRMATLGFGYDLQEWGRVTVEGYYKNMDNLQNFDPGEQRKAYGRSEEHTSELQSRGHLVCRLLLEKKNEQEVLQNYKRTMI